MRKSLASELGGSGGRTRTYFGCGFPRLILRGCVRTCANNMDLCVNTVNNILGSILVNKRGISTFSTPSC